MVRRFFCETPVAGDRATLVGPEAQHLARVLRARVGDEIEVFDGSGVQFPARVARLGRSAVELEIQGREAVDRELPFGLHLGVALPRGERQKWLVEKAVELGVTTLTPLRTQRGVAQPSSATPERHSRQVIEAAKQCGRNRLMAIYPPQEVAAFCRQFSAATLGLIADPAAGPGPQMATRLAAHDGDVALAVGPEGGWTAEELASAHELGWHSVQLGSRTLRVETAVCVLAALAGHCHRRGCSG